MGRVVTTGGQTPVRPLADKALNAWPRTARRGSSRRHQVGRRWRRCEWPVAAPIARAVRCSWGQVLRCPCRRSADRVPGQTWGLYGTGSLTPPSMESGEGSPYISPSLHSHPVDLPPLLPRLAHDRVIDVENADAFSRTLGPGVGEGWQRRCRTDRNRSWDRLRL